MVPAARRALTALENADVVHERRLIERARRLGMPDHEFVEAIKYNLHLIDLLASASLHWITAPMSRVMMDASQDVPAFAGVMAPSPSGLVLFEEPLPGWDVAASGGIYIRDGIGDWLEPVPVDALAWACEPYGNTVYLLIRPRRVPGKVLADQTNRDPLVPMMRLRTPPALDLDDPQIIHQTRPDQISLMAFLAAMWTLMASPGTASTSTIKAPTGKRHPRTGQAILDRVNVIDLRAPVHRPETTTKSGRKLTVRHLVRGHWTHQPHGPGRQKRRLQWIDPYIKGPSNAPLAKTETVYQWRR